MDLWWPLCMSLLAGLSTSIGGLIAVTLSPDEGTLAFLLGTAIGVMACVSGVELWWHSAAQLNDWIGVSAAVLGGAALFAVLDPLLPKVPETEELLEAQQPLTAQQQQQETSASSPSSSSSQHHAPQHHASSTNSSSDVAQAAAAAGAASPLLQAAAAGRASSPALQQADVRPATDSSRNVASGTRPGQRQKPVALEMQDADAVVDIQPPQTPSSSSDSKPGAHRQKSLLRLSLLMAVTLTLHNIPEGFAVAFSAFTDIGWIMVLAIGLHNVPEGLICAAPLYAATRSKWKAVGVATASGLSEPLGALLALLVFKPFVKSVAALDYVMAATGGVMLAVCVLELWPEGRRCGQDGRLLGGILLGTAVMAWTLYVGA